MKTCFLCGTCHVRDGCPTCALAERLEIALGELRAMAHRGEVRAMGRTR